MKQLLKNMYVKNKRVILRCDFNVPIKSGNIVDDTKIVKSLETINYLIKEEAKIIIMSHLGRVKTEEDKKTYSLEPVKKALESLLNKQIKLVDILSPELQSLVDDLNSGEVLLLENTRFLDVPNNMESTENEEMAKKIASLGDIFVMDAFAVAHRNHTTVTGIPKFMLSCLGFLAEKEMNMLDDILKEPEKPFTVVMGGAKVDDKLPIIKSLLPKCDHLLLSGGIANSFLNALGLNVGESLKTEDPMIIKELKDVMIKYKEKLALPLDAIVGSTYQEEAKIKNVNKIDVNDVIKDIGAKTINKYKNILLDSKTVFVNGTMGVYEEKEFKNGTIEIFEILKQVKGKVVIGGGDTVSAVNKLGYKNAFSLVSSGGGASLEYIAKGSLPGLDAIGEEDNIEVLDL